MRSSALWLAACAGLVLLVSSVSASGQRTGSRLGRDAAAKDAPAAMAILADCAVSRRPDLIREWFRLLPGTPGEGELLKKAANDLGACMDSDQLVMDGMQLSFRPHMMRYPVAEVLVRKHLPRGPAKAPVSTEAAPWFLAQLNALAPGAPVDRSALVLQDFGHCIALTNWEATRAFLLSKPASPEQKTAVAKLAPVLGPCLSKDVQIKLTPDNLRRVLAEPVYQILSVSTTRK